VGHRRALILTKDNTRGRRFGVNPELPIRGNSEPRATSSPAASSLIVPTSERGARTSTEELSLDNPLDLMEGHPNTLLGIRKSKDPGKQDRLAWGTQLSFSVRS